MPRILIRFVILVVTSFQIQSTDVFDDRERQLVQGLRGRGLVKFAEDHCNRLLESDSLSPKDQALIAIERIRNFTTAFSLSPAAEQSKSVGAIDRVVEDFEILQNGNPRLPLVWMQQALARMSFATLASRTGNSDSGIVHLKAAKTILDRNAWEVSRQLQGRRLQAGIGDEQLKSLQANIKYRLAVSDLILASLYHQQGSQLDKIDSLNNAIKRLGEVRNNVADTRELWWKTQIDELACQRLLGDFDQASRLVQILRSKKRPKSTDMLMLEQVFELAMATSDKATMKAIASETSLATLDRAETEIGLLKLLLTLGESNAAVQVAERISRHGPFWSRQADLMLLGRTPSTGNSQAAAPVVKGERIKLRIANEALAAGNLADAARAFEEVAIERLAADNPNGSMAAIVQSGKALEQAKDFKQAAKLYLKYSKQATATNIAPSIHLRGCWAMTQTKPTDPAFVDQLREHSRLWPDSETTNQANGWLAGQLIRADKLDEALETLFRISPDSKAFQQNLVQIRFCLDRLVQRNPDRTTARKLTSILEPVHERAVGKTKANLACEMAIVALSCSDPVADQRLEQLQSGLTNLGEDNEPFATLILAAGQIVLGKPQPDARSVASQCIDSGLTMAQLKRALGWMQRLDVPARLAGLEQALADASLAKENFAATEQDAALLKRTKAAALAAAGQTSQATALFEELIVRWPVDITIRRSMAAALGRKNGNLEKALDQWRWIASRSRSKTESWFQAKYESARILASLGRQQEALKLLRFIKAVPPGWEKSKYRNRFEKLMLECR